MEENSKEKSTSSAVDSHASHSVSQDEKKERKITATSGRKCFALYSKYSPLGSLVKTLLTSSIWHSPARKLIWKVRATPCSHLLFQLVPSERPTDETGFGLLPTVTAVQRSRPEVVMELVAKKQPLYKRRNKEGHGRQFSITDALLYRALMMPTPTSRDWKGASSGQKADYSRLTTFLHPSGTDITMSYPNPSFVEAMMGFPRGWTDLRHSETP